MRFVVVSVMPKRLPRVSVLVHLTLHIWVLSQIANLVVLKIYRVSLANVLLII